MPARGASGGSDRTVASSATPFTSGLAGALAAPEVARRVDEVRGRPVVARRQRLRLAVLVLPRHELADRAAVAARREAVEVLRDEPVQDEVHAGRLVELAGARHSVERREGRQLALEALRVAAGEPDDLFELVRQIASSRAHVRQRSVGFASDQRRM
jgi:hypothetical protein